MRFIAVIFLTTLTALAQSPLAQHISHDQAVRDTRTFINLLEDTHPDPYTAFGGRIEFRRKAQAILAGLPQDGIVVADLAARLRELIVPLAGHTGLNDGGWRDPDWWLPIQFTVATDGIVLATSDLEELGGLNGYRLTGANGHPVEKIAQEMRVHVRYENRSGALNGITNVVRSRKFMLDLFAGDDPDQITFQLQGPTGAIVDRRVPWAERRKFDADKCLRGQPHWSRLPASDDPFFTTIFDQPGAAYLRVANIMGREAYEIAWRSNTGDVREMLKDYYQRRNAAAPEDIAAAIHGVPSFFETAIGLLTEMKRRQIPTLIIDLRGNNGGWTASVIPVLAALYGDAFYSEDFPGQYITRESALFLQKYNSTVSEWRLKSGNPLFEPGDYSFETTMIASGPPASRREKTIAEYKQRGYSFAAALESLNGQPLYRPKNVVVLTDPGTYSAAFHFLYYLHHMGAKSVGVPPSQSPNAFMETTDFTLPESKLRGFIANSLQLYMPEEPKADTFPVDHPLTCEVLQRYGFDRETAVRYALDLIAAGKL
jgi:hypothetical protein